MPNLSKSINCKDLPINPAQHHGYAESGVVIIEGFSPYSHMSLKKVDEHTVEVCLNGDKTTFDLRDHNIKITFYKDGVSFNNYGYYSYSMVIRGVPEHKLYQLEECKKFLKTMGWLGA